MLKKDVSIDEVYWAKISNRIVPVQILSTSIYGGWNARNLETTRTVRIKSAAKLRGKVTPDDLRLFFSNHSKKV